MWMTRRNLKWKQNKKDGGGGNSPLDLRKDLKTMYELVLKEKYGTDGLERNEVIDLFDMLDENVAYPIELSAYAQESSAMGFITPKAAELIEYDYEYSGLHNFIALILDDMCRENDDCEYEFKGIKIWLSR